MAKRIMVVDDSRMVFLLMENLLKDTDYEIVAYCTTGEEALAQYEEVRPDIVTMDIVMPGIDGLETVKTILDRHKDAKIVMISSLAYDDTFEEAKALGAKEFLDKPIDREHLLEALDRIEID